MNTTKEQQKELDDSLVSPENHLKIGKSNLRLSSNLKSKEPTIQVVLDALKLTLFYKAFEISTDVPEIYMQELWHVTNLTRHFISSWMAKVTQLMLTTSEICSKFALNFLVRNLKNLHLKRIFYLLSKILDTLVKSSFYLMSMSTTCINLGDHLLRITTSVIRGRHSTHTGKSCLSRAQILWGMYNNKKVDYVYLLWEDLVFQVENKNSKKNSDMDDFMFTIIRVISKHKDTQEYGAILPQHLTNQAMLKSEAFKTYRAYATSEKARKSKATKKKTDSKSSPKTKPSQAYKGKRIKTLAKGDKHARTKSKGLTVLSEVALSEAEQMKLATKRSMKEFHISHASGSGDGVDLQSKVPDEQQQTLSGTNEGAGVLKRSEEESWTFSQGDDDEESDKHDSANEDDDQENDSQRTESDDDGDDFVHPNLSTYKADEEEEEKEEEKAEDDDEVTSDQKVSTPPNYELTEEDVNQEDDDTMGEDQEDEENGELYGDLNINLNRRDAEMTDAQVNQETGEVHVTLTTEPPVVQQQSSSVSSDLVSKFINPSPDTGIDLILNPNVQSDIHFNVSASATTETPSSDTTIPQSPIPIIQPQQQTLDSTTTTTIPTTTLPEIPNFASLFGFEQLKLKKILMDKMEENNSIDRSDVQKNLYKALLEAYNSDKDLLSSYGEVVTLKRGRDDQDKDEEPFAGSNRGTTRSPLKSSSKSVQEEEYDLRVDDLEEPLHQEFDTGNDNVSPVREATDVDERLWNLSGSRTPERE
ncbi:hypothetical protein Tco_0450535 [Tanacetum coccineum]